MRDEQRSGIRPGSKVSGSRAVMGCDVMSACLGIAVQYLVMLVQTVGSLPLAQGFIRSLLPAGGVEIPFSSLVGERCDRTVSVGCLAGVNHKIKPFSAPSQPCGLPRYQLLVSTCLFLLSAVVSIQNDPLRTRDLSSTTRFDSGGLQAG